MTRFIFKTMYASLPKNILIIAGVGMSIEYITQENRF
jgi:hypothetical protein